MCLSSFLAFSSYNFLSHDSAFSLAFSVMLVFETLCFLQELQKRNLHYALVTAGRRIPVDR